MRQTIPAEKAKITLTPEQETLLIPLYARGQPGNPVFFEPKAQEILNQVDYDWDFYSTQVQGLAVDLALAEDRGRSFVVLLVAEPEERDTLYELVFRPAVEALDWPG